MRRLIVATILSLSTLIACTTAAAQPASVPQPRSMDATTQKVADFSKKSTDWPAVIERQRNERLYWAEVVKQQKARAADAAWRARVAAYWAALHAPYPHGLCGGDLPPCRVMMRESGGNIHALNPSGDASGKWQFLDSTWKGYAGVRKAMYASEKDQDARARQVWDHGRGCSHWSACGGR